MPIEHKLRVVEAGAQQGEHKLARGYVPVTTHSAHYLANESFRNAVRNYLDSERREVEHIHAALEEHSLTGKHRPARLALPVGIKSDRHENMHWRESNVRHLRRQQYLRQNLAR